MATTHPIAPTPSRTESAKHRANLEEFERHDGRPAFVLNMTEVKLLGIAGVREIFTDPHLSLSYSLLGWIFSRWYVMPAHKTTRPRLCSSIRQHMTFSLST